MQNGFRIPIVLFFFKRPEKTIQIIKQISKIQPQKIYLISDGARNEEEVLLVDKCREGAERAIDWPCNIIKNYAMQNEGVFNRIALGAKWVFNHEETAIFLEDDNLPELSFFKFCEEMLERYKDVDRVLWICGTNYLNDCQPLDGSDYFFTQNMLPCGWASWGRKFEKYYDGYLDLWENEYVQNRIKKEYQSSTLLKQDIARWNNELKRKKRGDRFNSWDAQMAFSIKVHGLLGIVPKYNQICNIGVDINSIHGGTSLENIMTKRFCEIPTKSLYFPLKHPLVIWTDPTFENKISKIITLPLQYRIKGKINSFLKRILFIDKEDSLSEKLRYQLNKLFK